MVQMKHYLKSKTLRVAALQVFIGLAQYLQGEITAGTVLTVSGVIFALLRIVTKSGIKWE